MSDSDHSLAPGRPENSAVVRLAFSASAWILERVRLHGEQRIVAYFRGSASRDFVEVEVEAGASTAPAFARLRHCAVRYRGHMQSNAPSARDQTRSLVLGMAQAIDARLSVCAPNVTLAEALGRERGRRELRLSRESIRTILERFVSATVAGDWRLTDVYPSSHVRAAGSAHAEYVAAFERTDTNQRLAIAIAPRDDTRPAFASTEHIALRYQETGADTSSDSGATLLRALVALAFEVVDHVDLEVSFARLDEDLGSMLLDAPEGTPEPSSETDSTLNLALSVDCGQSCAFCSVKRVLPPEPDTDALLLRARIDLRDAAARGVRRLRLNGFDPLAYGRVIDVVREARALGFDHVDVFSPCTRLADANFCDSLCRSLPPSRSFFVPVYALDAALHDEIVGRSGAHALVMRALEHLLMHGPSSEITILSVPVTANVAHMPAVERFARERGFYFAAHTAYPSFESREDRYFASAARHTDIVQAFAEQWAGRSDRGVKRLALPVHGVAPCVAFRVLTSAGFAAREWLDAGVDPGQTPGAEYRDERFSHGARDRASSAFVAVTTPCPHAGACVLQTVCTRELLRAYLERHGGDEFRPVSLAELMAAT